MGIDEVLQVLMMHSYGWGVASMPGFSALSVIFVDGLFTARRGERGAAELSPSDEQNAGDGRGGSG